MDKLPISVTRVPMPLDEFDVKIIDLMIRGSTNQEIAVKLNRPLSTVQRRVRKLLESGLVKSATALDYKMLGMKRGQIHLSLADGDMMGTANRIAQISGILDVSIYLGNSDIVATYVCSDSAGIIELLAILRHMPAVSTVLWAEEVGKVAGKNPDLTYLLGLGKGDEASP